MTTEYGLGPVIIPPASITDIPVTAVVQINELITCFLNLSLTAELQSQPQAGSKSLFNLLLNYWSPFISTYHIVTRNYCDFSPGPRMQCLVLVANSFIP